MVENSISRDDRPTASEALKRMTYRDPGLRPPGAMSSAAVSSSGPGAAGGAREKPGWPAAADQTVESCPRVVVALTRRSKGSVELTCAQRRRIPWTGGQVNARG